MLQMIERLPALSESSQKWSGKEIVNALKQATYIPRGRRKAQSGRN